MKKTIRTRFLLALLTVFAPLCMVQAQTTFFSDSFGNGSTTNQPSIPGGTATASSTSYDLGSTKTVVATIGPNLLHLALSATTSSGFLEAQALFTTNAVSLNSVGDYIDIAVVFTNSAGTLFNGSSASSALYLGLFNSSDTAGTTTNPPVPFAQLASAGFTTTAGSAFATGNCALWQGYVGQIQSNAAPRIITRPAQTAGGTTPANQDLVASGAGSGAFANPAATALYTGGTSNVVLVSNGVYTLDLRITLSAQQNLTISNALYQGASTATTLVFSDITTNVTAANYIASAFDGLGFGLRCATAKGNELIPVMDVSSILITGQSSPPTPPIITQQPAPVQVATNGACAFTVSALGDNLTYQWYRNTSVKLSNGGDISGATSSQLVISPSQTADQFLGAMNGYYCIVSGAGNLSTNSTTNTLTLINSTNLIWGAQNSESWDINNTVNWVDTNGNQSVFNYGDPVIFDDSQNNSGGSVNVLTNFTAPSSVTVTGADFYQFNGPGTIAGPGPLWDFASARLLLEANNTYTGGTLISNTTAYVKLDNLGGLGSGPVTLGQAGGAMEISQAGTATTGIEGPVVVADNFTNYYDNDGSFSGVFLSDLSGTAGKTLSLAPGPTNPNTNQFRIRAYGGNTAYNANLALTDPNVLFASYQSSGVQIYNGIISGPGAYMQKGITTYLNNGLNSYSGGTFPAQGAIGLGASSSGPAGAPTSGPLGTGPIFLAPDSTTSTTGDGFIFPSSNSITLGNPIEYVSGTNNLTLEIGGSTNLTLTGPFTLYGNDHTAMTAFPIRSLIVTNTGLTIITNVINDGGSNYGFNLTGSGITLFNATEAWGGITTNGGGTMLVNGQVGPGAVIIATNATLGGIGKVTGSVTLLNGGTLAAGTESLAGSPGIGTLTINNTVTMSASSTTFVKVSKTGSTQDVFTGITTVNYNGILNATNIAGTSVLNDHYTIFSAGAHTGNFTSIIGAPGPGLAWSFDPNTGILSVIGGSSPFTVPPHISLFSITSATNLAVTVDNAQSGSIYYMVSTTNLLTPAAQWIPVGTNTAANANTYIFNITNAVNPKDLQQFFRFSSTP